MVRSRVITRCPSGSRPCRRNVGVVRGRRWRNPWWRSESSRSARSSGSELRSSSRGSSRSSPATTRTIRTDCPHSSTAHSARLRHNPPVRRPALPIASTRHNWPMPGSRRHGMSHRHHRSRRIQPRIRRRVGHRHSVVRRTGRRLRRRHRPHPRSRFRRHLSSGPSPIRFPGCRRSSYRSDAGGRLLRVPRSPRGCPRNRRRMRVPGSGIH